MKKLEDKPKNISVEAVNIISKQQLLKSQFPPPVMKKIKTKTQIMFLKRKRRLG
jgi:hypothetical protein